MFFTEAPRAETGRVFDEPTACPLSPISRWTSIERAIGGDKQTRCQRMMGCPARREASSLEIRQEQTAHHELPLDDKRRRPRRFHHDGPAAQDWMRNRRLTTSSRASCEGPPSIPGAFPIRKSGAKPNR